MAFSLQATDIVAIYISFLCILFRFTLPKPSVNQSPPQVQTYVPWLGAAISFLFRRTSFLYDCRVRYGAVYKFLVGGRHIVVVSSPTAVSQVLEMSPKVLQSPEEKGLELVSGLSERLPQLVSLLHKTAYSFLSGGLTKRSMGTITTPMSREIFSRFQAFFDAQEDERCVPLEEFVGRNLYRSSSVAFFGESCVPDTFSDFAAMDDGMFYLSNELGFLASGSGRARSRMADTLEQYVQQAWSDTDGYVEGASPIMSKTLQEFRKTGLSVPEVSRLFAYLLWGMNSNLIQTTTNALVHLLADPPTYHRIVADIRKAVNAKFPDFEMLLTADPEALEDDEFEILDSIIQETLRVSSLAASFRQAQSDTFVKDDDGSSYLIQKGEYVLVDVRGMHYDSDLFPEPDKFIPDRFLKTKASNKTRGIRTFRPWGGGAYICRGREYAQYAAKMFLIQAMYLFDIIPGEIEPSFEVDRSLIIARLRGSPSIRLRRK